MKKDKWKVEHRVETVNGIVKREVIAICEAKTSWGVGVSPYNYYETKLVIEPSQVKELIEKLKQYEA